MNGPEGPWGVDSEYGRLQDVLLCDPENFRWLVTSAITRATLEAGFDFDGERAARQHDALVSAYEESDVRCHFLEPSQLLKSPSSRTPPFPTRSSLATRAPWAPTAP